VIEFRLFNDDVSVAGDVECCITKRVAIFKGSYRGLFKTTVPASHGPVRVWSAWRYLNMGPKRQRTAVVLVLHVRARYPFPCSSTLILCSNPEILYYDGLFMCLS
jgi:hypothetical protein